MLGACPAQDLRRVEGDRLDCRQVVRVGVDGFFNWAEDTMRRISGKGALAAAMR